MKHSDLMILHKIKYKHIGMILLILGALSTKWTFKYFNLHEKLFLLSAISITCLIILIILIIGYIIENWDKTIL